MLGVAQVGKNTYYRYFLTDKTQTVRLRFTGLINKGNPSVMVKIKGHKIWPETTKPESYDFKEQLTDDIGRQFITLYPDTRFYEDPDCLYAGFAQDGGSELCGIYIGIECGYGEDNCAFRLLVELFDTVEDEETTEIELVEPE